MPERLARRYINTLTFFVTPQGFRNFAVGLQQLRLASSDWPVPEKYNTVLIACGTPAACLWLPQAQAVALPIFYRDVFVERIMQCVAL